MADNNAGLLGGLLGGASVDVNVPVEISFSNTTLLVIIGVVLLIVTIQLLIAFK